MPTTFATLGLAEMTYEQKLELVKQLWNELNTTPTVKPLPKLSDLKGISKGCTEGVSVKDFVEALRDD